MKAEGTPENPVIMSPIDGGADPRTASQGIEHVAYKVGLTQGYAAGYKDGKKGGYINMLWTILIVLLLVALVLFIFNRVR